MKNSFMIHSNYSRPFRVDIDEDTIFIYRYKMSSNSDSDENPNSNNYERYPFMESKYDELFVGKSPKNKMTDFSGGYGKEFDGNSILFKIGDTYVYVGDRIKVFKTDAKITKYISPVGNNDVPYPFAIDEKNDYYLLIEDVIVSGLEEGNMDPYDYYYDKSLITANIGIIPPQQPVIENFKNIVEFYINDEQYTLRYKPNPKKEYERISKDIGNDISILKLDGKKYKLNKGAYIKLMEDFAKEAGFRSF